MAWDSRSTVHLQSRVGRVRWLIPTLEHILPERTKHLDNVSGITHSAMTVTYISHRPVIAHCEVVKPLENVAIRVFQASLLTTIVGHAPNGLRRLPHLVQDF
jgi:hypothetical protein